MLLVAPVIASAPVALLVSEPSEVLVCPVIARAAAELAVSAPSVMLALPVIASWAVELAVSEPRVALVVPVIATCPVADAVRDPSVMLAEPSNGGSDVSNSSIHANQALASVRVNVVIVNPCPAVKLVESTVMSPPPPVAVTVPCT